MQDNRTIIIEGYTPGQILQLTDDQLNTFIFSDQPVIFRAGSATILGEFRQSGERLTIELAHIDGGGEGVLPTLWLLAEQYAKQHQQCEVEWIVHAITCAKPNAKLRRVLLRRGFTIRNVADIGEAYYHLHSLSKQQ